MSFIDFIASVLLHSSVAIYSLYKRPCTKCKALATQSTCVLCVSCSCQHTANLGSCRWCEQQQGLVAQVLGRVVSSQLLVGSPSIQSGPRAKMWGFGYPFLAFEEMEKEKQKKKKHETVLDFSYALEPWMCAESLCVSNTQVSLSFSWRRGAKTLWQAGKDLLSQAAATDFSSPCVQSNGAVIKITRTLVFSDVLSNLNDRKLFGMSLIFPWQGWRVSMSDWIGMEYFLLSGL